MEVVLKKFLIPVLLTAGLVFTTLSGLSVATVPDSDSGLVIACRNADHAVRIIDTENAQECNEAEDEVSWGASGGTVFFDNVEGSLAITGGVVVVQVPDVPPGRYTVTAKTRIQDTSGTANFAQCGLTGLGYSEASNSSVVPNGFTTLYAQGVVELTTATDVEFFCNPAAASNAHQSSLIITSVSGVVG